MLNNQNAVYTQVSRGNVFTRTSVRAAILKNLNLNLNSLLVKRQIDNPSPGAVTGGN